MAFKMKTHRGASKRFKKTANGFKRKKAFLRHNLRKHNSDKKRVLRQKTFVSGADYSRVLLMLPNN